jgi:HSP20 family protein
MIWNLEVLNEMDRLRREMNGLFSNFDTSGGTTTFPLVNMYDEKDEFVVTAELPGMTKDKVTITFSDGVLTITGNLEPFSQVREMAVVRKERPEGAFEKDFRIPAKVDQGKINATFTNGILTVTLPKAEEAKPKTISIEAK